MAHIDDLVKQVSDPQLRAALMQQVSTLTSRKQFGLVFQEHSPESVRLPQQRVRTGDKVELRESKESATYHVISTKASLDIATVVELDESGETVGEPQDMIKADLVVIKPFGDPVYPGLRQVGEAGSAKPGQPTHVVINGENFHALQALEYTHAGKVDLIYIDPPYNTGNSGWKYNDKYIDGTDSYRHSKWLSFMEKRLKFAKRLLKDTGFLAISIDDSEQARLKVLADQIFHEDNYAASLVWRSKSGGANDSDIAVEHEYVLLYRASPNAKVLPDPKGAATTSYNRTDPDGKKYSLERLDKQNLSYSSALDYAITGPDGDMYNLEHKNPAKPNAIWRWGKSTVESRYDELVFEKGRVYTKNYEKDSYTPRSLMIEERFGRTRTGGTDLAKIMGDRRFTFPKPVNLLQHLVTVLAPTNAVVVDFFAGSGTTAEAVIRLNDEDAGTRQCILVTNNELSKSEDAALRKNGFRPGDSEYEAMGVFHHVTMPRISTVLTGVREDGSKYSDGVSGQSAAFFDLTYEDENLVSLGNKFEAIAPLLWMQSGATGDLVAKRSDLAKGESGYSVPEDGNYTVIFDTEAAADAIAALHNGIKKVFIVTDSENDFKAVTANLPGNLKNTAQRLYSSYLRSFEINRG